MSRRVGILTFHRSLNYGSYWQARCLVEAVEAAGHRAELLDHDCAWVNRREARCLMQPTLPIRSPRADFPAYKAKARKFRAAVEALPLSRRFSLYAPADAPAYDRVVVGSDEVWNFRHPWYGRKGIFFGDGLVADRLVSYAASFGNHDAALGMDDYWSGMIARFSDVSVRDANSRALVAGALAREPRLVVDPVLLHPAAIRTAPLAEVEPYVLVYGHGFPGWLAASVVRWSRRRGIRLVSLGYRNDWADEQRLDAGPHDFASMMAGAAAVVTNFFHGCVFALVNGKPWVTAPSDYRFNKIRDLAAKLGAERHVLDATGPEALLDVLLSTPADPSVARRIAELRAGSRAFLAEALS